MSENAEGPIRVVLVDDHGIVRGGMRAYLEMTGDIAVTGEAADGQAALDRLAALAAAGPDGLPDVVLMDLLMPKMDGIAATAAIRARYPEVEVLALTSFLEEEKIHGALAAGAAGYLLKDAEPDEVAAAIRAARRGEVRIDPAVAARLMRAIRAPRVANPLGALTEREREVLVLVGRGAANKEIARELGISERTARTHVSNILGKLDLPSRTQAALFAAREGLVP